MIPFGEWLPDQGTLNNPGATVADNVFSAAESYLPLSSLGAFSDAAADRVRGGIFIKNNTETVYGYVGTDDELYQVGATLTDVSRSSGGAYTTTEETNWEFTQFGNQVVAVNFNDDTQIITAGGANFAALAGSPPRAKHVATVGNFVVLGNTSDTTDGHRTNRIWWSGSEDITNWTPATNQSDNQDLLGSGGAVNKIIGGDYGVVFRDRSIHRMDYVGTPIIFEINEVEPERGTSLPGSVVQKGRSIFYISQDGFYELIDGAYSNPIGAEKVNRFFLEDLDTNYKHRVSSAIDPVNNLAVWSYPGEGNSNGTPNKLIIYNWITKRFTSASITAQYIFNGFTTGFTLENLDSFGTLETLPFSLDSAVWNGGNLLLAGANISNQVGYFNGAALDAVIETSEFGGERTSKLRSVRSYIEGDGNTSITIQIGHRSTLRANPVWTTAQALNADGVADILRTSRYMRARANITGGFTHAKGLDPAFIEGGKW